MDKPVPIPDRDSAPFWEGMRAGEVRLQRCTACGTWRWPARAICNRCHGFDAEWVAVGGTGTVISWIRTHQAFLPAFQDDLPYVTVTVQLDEQADLQMIGGLADRDIEPEIGMRVRAAFTDGDQPLVFWRPL